jgi:hypothetical protein
MPLEKETSSASENFLSLDFKRERKKEDKLIIGVGVVVDR